ncbi:MAG: hypothetical protein EOL86_03435 [Deltaproteobacteria bacterium]|nr:hypothetical protein [Deltaproteobacteria bacterium]
MAEAIDACTEMAKVFHFEFWLRYYFIEEREDGVYIKFSEEQSKQMQAQFPDFWELVEQMLDQPLSPELSQRVVVEFLQLNYDGKKFPPDTAPQVLDSKEFSIEMYLFDTWLGLHEEQLMQKIYGFDSWMHAFTEWKTSERGQKVSSSLAVRLHQENKSLN